MSTGTYPRSRTAAPTEGFPAGRLAPRRIGLQRRAPQNLRRHWLRAAFRVSVLVSSDVAVFLVIRGLLRGVRGGWLGPVAAEWTNSVFPSGFLGGWQFAVAILLSLAIAGAYGAGDKRRDTGRVFYGVSLATVMVLYTAAWEDPGLWMAAQYAGVVLGFALGLVASRSLVDVVVRLVRPRVDAIRALMVARAGADWRAVAALLADAREFTLVGAIQLDGQPMSDAGASLASLSQMIEEKRAEAVLVWGPLNEEEFAYVVDVALASGCRLLTGPRTPTPLGVEPRAAWIGGRSLVELTAPGLHAWQLAVKRAVDMVVSAAGLILCAPLMVIIAAAIRLESRGSVLFRQWRVGRAGKPFEIYKFRSMLDGAEQQLDELRKQSIYKDGRLFKVVSDPRVTRVGSVLRKTSLDELPQLFNVLRGDMSLVGPRPPLLQEVALYEEHHYCRFDVKPGITGPWQVSGRNAITDFEQVIRLESAYIREWSVWLDFKILLRTLPVVLRMSGAH